MEFLCDFYCNTDKTFSCVMDWFCVVHQFFFFFLFSLHFILFYFCSFIFSHFHCFIFHLIFVQRQIIIYSMHILMMNMWCIPCLYEAESRWMEELWKENLIYNPHKHTQFFSLFTVLLLLFIFLFCFLYFVSTLNSLYQLDPCMWLHRECTIHHFT